MYDKELTFDDHWGNKFVCTSGKLTLQLKSEPNRKPRKIGEIINIKDYIVYKKFEKEKDIYQKTNAWSVPVEVFERVDGIWFYTNENDYKIMVKTAKEKMHYLTFSNSGYERKVYIPLDLWTIKSKFVTS